MITNDDPRWSLLTGGYRVPYDPRSALDRLRTDGNDREAWNDLWQNLHHQGDLGDASYVAVVVLAKIRETTSLSSDHLFSLVSTIEVERHRRTNPQVPAWLTEEYRDAWKALSDVALRELRVSEVPEVVQPALAVVALAKGILTVGALLWYHDESTLREYLEERLSWSDLYASKTG